MGKMYDYWERQPAALKRILTARKELTREFVQLFQEIKPDKLYLIGSGTSLNASAAAARFIEKLLQVDVFTAPPSNLPEIRGERPMIVFISQGGSSTNTLEAMEKLSRYPSVSMTGEADCEISRRSAHHMLIGCGEELAGPKTIGYTASVMCFYVCALEAGLSSGMVTQGAYGETIRTLELAACQMEQNISAAQEWFERNQEELKQIQKYVLVGCGAAALAGMEGCLKILETIKVPAMSFEFEEYLHGPIILTDGGLGGLFFISDEPNAKQRMIELVRCHQAFSPYAYPIMTNPPEDMPRALPMRTTGAEYTKIFEAVLVPQLLAARVPELAGISDGSEVYDAYTQKCPTKYNNGR